MADSTWPDFLDSSLLQKMGPNLEAVLKEKLKGDYNDYETLKAREASKFNLERPISPISLF